MALDQNIPLVSNQIATDLIALNTNWEELIAMVDGKVSDSPYATNWNGVTTTAPSMNVVYDKVNAIDIITSAISAYGKTLIDDVDASTALTTLGVSTFAKTILDDVNAATTVVTLGLTATAEEINSTCDGATTKNEHTHAQTSIDSAAVGQAQLKTSQGSVNGSWESVYYHNLTLPGGEYGFYPQIKHSLTPAVSKYAYLGWIFVGTSYYTGIAFTSDTGEVSGTVTYAQQRYVTSSGEVFWIFILRDKVSKEIVAMYQSPDHPCFGNGGKPSLIQHPFRDYDETKHEIIVINPSHEDVEKMKKECERGEDEPDLDLLELFYDYKDKQGNILRKAVYGIDESSNPSWPSKPVTVGLPKDYHNKVIGENIIPIKKVIPKPDNILCKSLKAINKQKD